MDVHRRNLSFRGIGKTWLAEGRWLCPRRGAQVALLAALAFSGCGAEVDDPNSFKRALELELTTFANTAEDAAQRDTPFWVFYQALLADVLQEGYPLSEIPDWQLGFLGDRWHAGRVMALDVEARIVQALGASEAEAFPLTTQVRWARGLTELYLGMTFCKAHLDGANLTDTQLLREAERSLGSAIESARAAGRPGYLAAAQAGRAQARMLLEDWAGAESDAMAVPAGFSYVSYQSLDDINHVWQWTSAPNKDAGLLHKWWPLVEESEDPGFMMDPWSGEPDPRIPVHYDGGTLDDGVTPHYQPLKYDSPDDDIPIVHSDMAQLIIAEAKAVGEDYAGATTVLNGLRSAVGLPPHDTPTSAEEMEELILWERFAELHLEGQRLIDLHRKGLMEQVFEELNDPERPGVGRRSKWGDCTDQS